MQKTPDFTLEEVKEYLHSEAHYIEAVGHFKNAILYHIEKLEAERDAAVEDIKEAHDSYCGCVTCKNYRVNGDCQEPPDTFCPNCSHDDCPCKGCSSNLEKWEWRGVQKEG